MSETQAPGVVQASNNPFAGAQVATRPAAGALVSVEQQRVIAEVQARMMLARSMPRNPAAAMEAILQECMRPTVAEHALYQYARGGTDIEGVSIRLMEVIAQKWGNIACGFKEIARANGASEVLVEAWDLETGFYDFRQFQVRHWRDTKQGGYPIRDERDIYELIANQAQRRKRSVMQSVIARDVQEAAVAECERTLKAHADTSPQAIAKMLEAFAQWGIGRTQIEARIQRRLDAITPAQVINLKKVYTSLRDEMSAPGDWFDMTPPEQPAAAPAAPAAPPATGNAGLRNRMRERAARKTPPAQEDERSGTAPENEAPTEQHCFALADSGDFDAAYDLAETFGPDTVKRVDAYIKKIKQEPLI